MEQQYNSDVGAPRNATTSPPSQRSQNPIPAPSSERGRCPFSDQLHSHVGVLGDDLFRDRTNEGREDMPPFAENIAAEAQLYELQNLEMGYYNNLADYYLPPQGHRDHIIGDNARIIQDAPFAPLAQEIGAFNNDIQQAAVGYAPALFEVPYQGPVPNGSAYEALRELALVYLSDPSSRLATFYMEPSNPDEVTVFITLKLNNL